ncbi:DivIVA domain-containing protein [Curtobacterium sp. ODYSSEY 48 V2]|uniref:DivIVA domain-containing protein n=1 Tax=Curtobacterium sp. ODYSSEY 48 V2 TaxID=2939561 RepID=UPI0035A9836B
MARAPVVGSGCAPAWTCVVSNRQAAASFVLIGAPVGFGPSWRRRGRPGGPGRRRDVRHATQVAGRAPAGPPRDVTRVRGASVESTRPAEGRQRRGAVRRASRPDASAPAWQDRTGREGASCALRTWRTGSSSRRCSGTGTRRTTWTTWRFRRTRMKSGYDCDEVDDFLVEVVVALRALAR